jgi:hypothetical protein
VVVGCRPHALTDLRRVEGAGRSCGSHGGGESRSLINPIGVARIIALQVSKGIPIDCLCWPAEVQSPDRSNSKSLGPNSGWAAAHPVHPPAPPMPTRTLIRGRKVISNYRGFLFAATTKYHFGLIINPPCEGFMGL